MSVALSGAAVVEKSIGVLRPNPRNARRHAKRQIRLIADSIEAFGFVNPILADETDMVLAGHGRLEAAKLLKRDHLPTLCITGLSDAQKCAYVLADNKLAEAAGWDRGMLATELGELAILLPTLTIDWNVEVTGFALGEIDGLINDQAGNRAEPEGRLPQPRAARVTRPGLSVTIVSGVKPCFPSSLRMSRTVAAVFRFDCTNTSRISPSLSTARHSQDPLPAIVPTISFLCQRPVGRGRRHRSSRANNGLNLATQRRTVS
jgi:ParB-like nuclease domain